MSDNNNCEKCDEVKCAKCGALVTGDGIYYSDLGSLCFDCWESSGTAGREHVESGRVVTDSIKPLIF